MCRSIFGINVIGVDILKVSRIEDIINRFGQRFMTKFFHPQEIKKAQTLSKKSKIYYLAKRFAAKEAILKSRGGAFGIKFSDICIQNDQYGKPLVFYKDKKLDQTEISLSDDTEYAIAFVITKDA